MDESVLSRRAGIIGEIGRAGFRPGAARMGRRNQGNGSGARKPRLNQDPIDSLLSIGWRRVQNYLAFLMI